jgi:hypothetical protein
MPAKTRVGMGNAASHTPVELALQTVMVAKRLRAVTGCAQHSACLLHQGSRRGSWRYSPASGHMVSDPAHGASSDRRYGLQQMTGLWIPMESLRYLGDDLRQMRSGPGHHFGNLGKSPLRHGSDRLGHNRQQFAGGHADERQKVLRSFLFALGFCREFAQVLHYCVWINLTDRADFVLVFIFGFVFAFSEDAAEKAFLFAFTQYVAEKIFPFAFTEYVAEEVLALSEDAAEKIFAFQFVFRLVLEFFFELVFEFSFQFTFVRHDESSCEKW